MKYTKNLLAATPAIIAAAALTLSVRSPVKAGTLFAGYGCVLALGALVALEYRINWKRLVSR